MQKDPSPIEGRRPVRHTIGVVRLALLALGLSVAISACSLGEPADDATGEEIYQELCAGCHGGDLGGAVGPPLGPGSNASDQPDEFLEMAIMSGRGRMPSFSSTLEQDQLERLIGYLRVVQQP